MLGELTWKDQSNGGLNLARRKGGLLSVLGKLGRFGGDALKDVSDEGVHDHHRLLGDARVWVHLLQLFSGKKVRTTVGRKTLARSATRGRLLDDESWWLAAGRGMCSEHGFETNTYDFVDVGRVRLRAALSSLGGSALLDGLGGGLLAGFGWSFSHFVYVGNVFVQINCVGHPSDSAENFGIFPVQKKNGAFRSFGGMHRFGYE